MEKVLLRGLDGSKSILELLSEKNIYLSAQCGGKGTCGKCKVFIDGQWVLGCKSYPYGDVVVQLDYRNEDSIKVERGIWEEAFGDKAICKKKEKKQGICIDLGTTTIIAALVDFCSGEIINQASGINHQRIYGTDVISRIDASNKGKSKELQQIVSQDLDRLIDRLESDKQLPIVISANTTMEHLLLGYSCQTLGKAPYTPVNIGIQKFGRVTILPGISTFVGADIVSGICGCGMDQSREITALIDLGTNGEMAIGNKDKILVTSTAAGPAFEGGNISCGVAGIPGAISKVKIRNRRAEVKTIDEEEAIGICGSGVLEIVFELLKAKLIDKTGLMKDKYFDEGFPLTGDIAFTQKDVRQVQMAKAAIGAGLETIAIQYGITMSQIDRLYLSGGFGQKIDVHKACAIGMIPEKLEEYTIAIGNSSLTGATGFAVKEGFGERMIKVANTAEEVSLANSKEFNQLYMDYMSF